MDYLPHGQFMEKLNREDCIGLLVEKSEWLKAQGEDRLPKRSDFTDYQVMAIKAALGPFPRALETAGLKQENPERLRKKQEKAIRHKRAMRERKLSDKE